MAEPKFASVITVEVFHPNPFAKAAMVDRHGMYNIPMIARTMS